MENEKLNTTEFDAYFKEDLEAIEEELKKSQSYSEIIDEEIKKLSAPGLATKGGQHYLIEHITNAVQLQTQRQGLRKDRVAIKKLILDYTNKEIDRNLRLESLNNSDSSAELMESIRKLIEEKKSESTSKKQIQNTENLDAEIDTILNKTDKGEE